MNSAARLLLHIPAFCIALCLAVSHGRASTHEAIWRHTSWSGGAGPQDTLFSSGGNSELKTDLFQFGVTGRLAMQVNRPRTGKTTRRYTAQLVLHDGAKRMVFRGTGLIDNFGSVGIMDAEWRTAASQDPIARVNLAPLVGFSDTPQLVGSVGLIETNGTSRFFPLFALPRLFHRINNPFEGDLATGRFSTFLRDEPQPVDVGTGSGGTTIDRAGKARTKVLLGDQRSMTASADVLLAAGGQPVCLFASPVGRRGFCSGFFLLDTTDEESHWNGWAFRPESADPRLRLLLSQYTRPAQGQTVLSWDKGHLDLDLPQADGTSSPPADGVVGWRNTRHLAPLDDAGAISGTRLLNGANGYNARLIRLAVDPVTGLVSGRLKYTFQPDGSPTSAGEHSSRIVARVNQKTGCIEGLVAPRLPASSSGFLEVSPRAP